MRKTYRFRLYPSKKQESILCRQLDIARFVYNQQLEFKIGAYKREGVNLNLFDLNHHLIALKSQHPALKGVYSQVLQNIAQRVMWAFAGFYRRVKKKEKAGFPRFKGKHRYDSLTYPQSGFFLEGKLHVSKVGAISIVQHRPVKGKIKTLTIKKMPTGKWYACFSVEEIQERPLPRETNSVGIDLGLQSLYADSNGNLVKNPRHLQKSEAQLAALQRKHAKKKKGSRNRNKSRLRLALRHEKIAHQRSDFHHKETKKLAEKYTHIAVEQLAVERMMRHPYLARSIGDASWGKFLQLLSYKVEETGGMIVGVNARGTSQACICGNAVKKTLAARVHRCPECGITMDRDIMAAMIIHQRAFQGNTVGSTGINAWGDGMVIPARNQELSVS